MGTREEAVMSDFNEEMMTMKKKIQLSEGQRKAEYEEFDAEKKRIVGQIRALKKEIREMSSAKPTQLIDLEELKKSGRPTRELKAYEEKTPEEVMEILDLQCIDLQKKLDLTKFEIGKKKERYATSLKEMKKLAEHESQSVSIMPLNTTNGQLVRLENKIHEAGLHLLEMRHLERKYTKMRQSLLDDRVFFQSTLDKYEEEIAKQAKEIEHLQSVRDEAIRLRDKTRRKLAKLEAEVVAQGIQREQQLQELKRKVEGGRAYLEKVERSLVPTSKLPQHDSGDTDENGVTAEQQMRETLQAKLQKLKEVTGAKDEDDIIEKLKTQRMTKQRLLNLKKSIELEKKKLELKKEQLEAELEAVKFSEVKEKEQNEEEYERNERALKEAMDELEEARKKYTKEKLQLGELKEQVKELCMTLKPVNEEKLPDSDDDVFLDEQDNTAYLDDLIKVTKSKFNQMIQMMEELNLQFAIEEPLSSLYLDTGLMEGKVEGRKGDDKEGEKTVEDMPDVPSREHIKRQSQLMAEAQGKRKGYPK